MSVVHGPDECESGAPGRVPARVCLRPGVRVVRRDERHQQVGLDHLALVVPDHPATDRTLADLAAGRVVDAPRVDPRLLARLVESELLVDARALVALRPSGAQARDAVGAAFAAHGPQAVVRLAARRSRPVEVVGPDGWAADARRLLTLAGLPVRPIRSRRSHDGEVSLVLAAGEPRRGDLDDIVRAGRPHLVVASVLARIRVGPFVVPGVTACLRCLDAHRAEHDPRWALVVEQQADAPGEHEPVDPVLGTLALGHAVRDLVAWAEGERPTTWSATVTVDAGSDLIARRWAPHPCCGCRWGNSLPVD